MHDEREAHPGCYAQEHHQRVHKAGHARKVVLVRDIPEPVGERHSGNQQNQRADNHVAEAVAYARGIQEYAQQRAQKAGADVAQSLGEIGSADLDHEKVERHSGNQAGRAVHYRTSEYGAEASATQGCGQELQPERRCGQRLDLIEPPARRLEREIEARYVPRKLVHRHDLVEPGPLDGYELGIGIGASGGEYAVAQHEELLPLLAIVGCYALHGLLDTGDFRTVLEQYPPCFGCKAEDLFAVAFLHCKINDCQDTNIAFFATFAPRLVSRKDINEYRKYTQGPVCPRIRHSWFRDHRICDDGNPSQHSRRPGRKHT